MRTINNKSKKEFDILYQPQKYRINEISEKGDDIDGDIYRPIHLITKKSETFYKTWVKRNQHKCLVICVKETCKPTSPVYNYAISKEAESFFWDWFLQIVNGTAPAGPSILISK